jgi:hypothetical protein
MIMPVIFLWAGIPVLLVGGGSLIDRIRADDVIE